MLFLTNSDFSCYMRMCVLLHLHACMRVCIYWHENSSKANQYRLADISIRQADIRHLINFIVTTSLQNFPQYKLSAPTFQLWQMVGRFYQVWMFI